MLASGMRQLAGTTTSLFTTNENEFEPQIDTDEHRSTIRSYLRLSVATSQGRNKMRERFPKITYRRTDATPLTSFMSARAQHNQTGKFHK